MDALFSLKPNEYSIYLVKDAMYNAYFIVIYFVD